MQSHVVAFSALVIPKIVNARSAGNKSKFSQDAFIAWGSINLEHAQRRGRGAQRAVRRRRDAAKMLQLPRRAALLTVLFASKANTLYDCIVANGFVFLIIASLLVLLPILPRKHCAIVIRN